MTRVQRQQFVRMLASRWHRPANCVRTAIGLIVGILAVVVVAILPRELSAQVESPDGPNSGDVVPLVQTTLERTHYLGREIAATMHYTGAPWLIRESRGREEDCEMMLEQLQVRPGMTVCDMGCGNGFYSLKLAELVGPKGSVLAVDIQPEMLRLLQARAEEAQHHNIRPILGDVDDPQLPHGKVDRILCVDVYHEFSHPEEMLRAMRRALTKDGQLVLVEFRSEDPKVPIKPLHKMSKRQVSKELLPNQFRLVRQFDELPWQHMLFFMRDEAR